MKMNKISDAKSRKAVRACPQIGRILTGNQIAGCDLTVFSDDAFLTSYPRSGNTWGRFLIGNLIYQAAPVTFANIEARIPEIHFHPDHHMRALARPRIAPFVRTVAAGGWKSTLFPESGNRIESAWGP
jgi:hypothetical protein